MAYTATETEQKNIPEFLWQMKHADLLCWYLQLPLYAYSWAFGLFSRKIYRMHKHRELVLANAYEYTYTDTRIALPIILKSSLFV